jgi:hypothetical protein
MGPGVVETVKVTKMENMISECARFFAAEYQDLRRSPCDKLPGSTAIPIHLNYVEPNASALLDWDRAQTHRNPGEISAKTSRKRGYLTRARLFMVERHHRWKEKQSKID